MRAIDVHVHPSTAPFSYERRWGREVAEFMPKYYRIEEKIRTDEELALLIGWDLSSSNRPRDFSRMTDDSTRFMKSVLN